MKKKLSQKFDIFVMVETRDDTSKTAKILC